MNHINCLKQRDNLDKVKNKEFVLDQELASYYQSLVGFDQKKFYANEIYRRNNLQFKMLNDL